MTATRLNRNRRSLFGAVVAIAIAIAVSAASAGVSSVETRWSAFQADPVKTMNQPPQKTMGSGKGKVFSIFSATDIKSRNFILKKSQARDEASVCDESGVCLDQILAGRAAAKQNPQDFFDAQDFTTDKPVLKLDEMEAAGLRDAELPESPWSDHYWPISQGVLGARFVNEKFTDETDWKGYFDYISNKKNTLKSIFETGTPENFEDLSPSEKYDILIGDLKDGSKIYEAGYLTPHMWAEGEKYWSESGTVEEWMGICHGWAPASYMVKRPANVVQATAANGTSGLKFFPSDIKGLASYLWAKARVATRFIGGRCNEKTPVKDKDTGRVLDEKCFDTNPANWHQIVVNQIGVAKRSFVMDATFDYEVWNQPIYSYSYTYFNPQTGKEVKKLSSAMVAIDKYNKDKFKTFRPKATAFVVGIAMDVVYISETRPTHDETDSSVNDSKATVSYMYDLELDKDMNVIGGEWYSNIHPDFLWNPVADSRPQSIGDGQLTNSWDASQPLPTFWRDIAIQTAIRVGLPLAAIVESLVESANQKADAE